MAYTSPDIGQYVYWDIFVFWVGKKNVFKKEQNHKILNKSPRGHGEVAKFSENDLLYDIN